MRLYLIVHDVRSCHNVGSLLRTAEGLGVDHIYLTGFTPYPVQPNDDRLPHLRTKIHQQIHKTALGAENNVSWSQHDDLSSLITKLKKDEVEIIGLEQTDKSIPLPDFRPTSHIAILLGREVEGISPEILEFCDKTVEIPMFGKKESFNVVQAAAMTLYQCRFFGG